MNTEKAPNNSMNMAFNCRNFLQRAFNLVKGDLDHSYLQKHCTNTSFMILYSNISSFDSEQEIINRCKYSLYWYPFIYGENVWRPPTHKWNFLGVMKNWKEVYNNKHILRWIVWQHKNLCLCLCKGTVLLHNTEV